MRHKYPSHADIEAPSKNMEIGNYQALFKSISLSVDWTALIPTPATSDYTLLADFQKNTLRRLSAIMKDPGIRLKVLKVNGGGDHEWATVELIAYAVCNNGERAISKLYPHPVLMCAVPGLPFENMYAWIVRFDEEGKVVQVRAYLDSTLVKQTSRRTKGASRKADGRQCHR